MMTSLLREHWQLPDHYYDCTSSLLHQLLLLMCKLLDASCDNNRRRSRLFSTPKTWNHTSTPEFDVVFGPVLPLIQKQSRFIFLSFLGRGCTVDVGIRSGGVYSNVLSNLQDAYIYPQAKFAFSCSSNVQALKGCRSNYVT